MPPKLFKIKKTENNADDGNEDILLSDYQLQRIQQKRDVASSFEAERLRRAQQQDVGVGVRINEGESSAAAGASAATSSETVSRQRIRRDVLTKRTVSAAIPTSLGRVDVLPYNTMDLVLSTDEEMASAYRPVLLRTPQQYDVNERVGATTTAKSGTAFLEEEKRERETAYRANAQLFNDAMSNSNDTVMLVQLPRMQSSTMAINLDNLPPGKIGKLVVYKCGKTVLQIGDVKLDVACGPLSDTTVEVEEKTSSEGISQFAVAIDQTNAQSKCCYQLAWIPRKVVCTPMLDGIS